MELDYEGFKKAVFALTKIDLNSYKEKQMRRRIDTLISKNHISGYSKFIEEIKTNTKLFEEFVTYLTINVSEFYRNPEQWKVLEEQLVPELISKFGTNLTIWSAACSTGDEPYSLVMAFSKHLPLNKIKIIATDLDKQVLQRAKIGLYTERSLAAVPKDLKDKYFTKIGASFQLNKEIMDRVEFKEHNLLLDKYPTNCHLIVCRNVLIYFTDEAKDEVFINFNKALVKNGILFIGSTEQMINYKDLGYNRKSMFFYAKE